MSIFRKLFGGGETVPWESMPRLGKTFIEKQREPWEQPGMMEINRFVVAVTPEDMADKACAWNVPTFYMINAEASCFLKIDSLPDDTAVSLANSVNAGKTMLAPSFHAMPTYPVVALVLQVPTPSRTIKLEAIPDLTTPDVRDCLDNLLQKGTGIFYLLTGEPSRLLAKGKLQVSSLGDLRRCLDRAACHYKSITPSALNYRAAGEQYFATTSL
jgi:hypothetical protein